jgi:hypothetical protein
MAQHSRALSDKLKRIEVAAQKIPALSASLNTVSDQLAKSVNELDGILKRFGLGIPVWVVFNQRAEIPYYDNDEIGYAKIGGRWGISIRTFQGTEERGQPTIVEQWPFNEAPRHLRVQGAEKLPDLMEAMVTNATEMEKRIVERTSDVKAVAETMTTVFDKIAPPRGKNTTLAEIAAAVSVVGSPLSQELLEAASQCAETMGGAWGAQMPNIEDASPLSQMLMNAAPTEKK